MSAEELRGRRGYVKGKLTRIANYVDDVRNKKVTPVREDLLVRLEKLDKIESEFQCVVEKLIEVVEEHALSPEDASEQERFENRYYEVKAVLTRWSESLKPQATSANNASEGSSAGTPSSLERVLEQQMDLMRQLSMQQSDGQQSLSNIKSRVRLPVIKLPVFDGKVEEWKQFSDSFKTLIHDSELPKVQKHQYLISALSGNTAKTIEAVKISEQNYDVAWNLLKARFDNDKTLRRRHIQCLFEMPRVEKESSVAIQNLVDHTQKHLRVLKSMKLPTDQWDDILLFMMEDKLDKTTRRHWEESIEGKETISIDMMMSFLQRRRQLLERMTPSSNATGKESSSQSKVKTDSHTDASSKGRRVGQASKPVALVATSHTNGRCYVCNGPHFIYSCEKFLKLSIDERIAEVKRLRLCLNCLKNDHFIKSCRASSCRECSGRHNTLCHQPAGGEQHSSKGQKLSGEDNQASDKSGGPAVHHAFKSKNSKYILMSTAIVNVVHANGSVQQLRVLLDSASEANFITRSACNRVGAKLIEFNESISGLNDMSCKVNYISQININSQVSNCKVSAQCLVVPKITKDLPSISINVKELLIPNTIRLADPHFSEPGQIDMLLGGEFFFQLLDQGKIELGTNLPTLHNTKFGWIVSGPILSRVNAVRAMNPPLSTALTCLHILGDDVNDQLTRFWEIEECGKGQTTTLSNEENLCENLFQENVSRDLSGRFIVRLPFRDNKSSLGESRKVAEKRLNYLERKFKANNSFRESYVNFMKEYIDLGHMTLVPSNCQSNNAIVYLPHHGVLQESQGKPKLRVVFDASAKTSSGLSLNDTLMVGATLQDDLFNIVLRFRLHPIVMSCDIQKMYRQITVNEDDRDYQRILWRFSPDDNIQEYQLNTVTYGESCAPFLAIRCIRQLATEESRRYEQASRALLRDLYVDDILTGVENLHEAKTLIEQLQSLLKRGQFHLHKWRFNRNELTAHINESNQPIGAHTILNESRAMKTLGLEWEPVSDTFQFGMTMVGQATTKRQLLSSISKLFDPLGIISPIIVRAKLIMQETWRLDLGWDDELPDKIQAAWNGYIQDLENCGIIHVPRHVMKCSNYSVINLHAFCDSSERAYGACVYVQTASDTNHLDSMLLCAKSRVAPVKRLTTPKLELCGAVLLVDLIDKVREVLQINFTSIHAWTDSTIVLAWISGDTSKQKTFVSNRVTRIIASVPSSHWHHVQGKENPADLVSRGTNFENLKFDSLWWSGPSWLSNFSEYATNVTDRCFSEQELTAVHAELKSDVQVFTALTGGFAMIEQTINRSSTLTKIERIFAFCLRFIPNLRSKRAERVHSTLSVLEISRANQLLIKYIQGNHFAKEIGELNSKGQINTNSRLLCLNPFLDSIGLLRVGGRLEHSSLDYDGKHPILLPGTDRFTRLLFEREHRRLAHAGPQLLLYSIRERYWPLRGRDIARKVVHECVRCFRNKPKHLTQIMGQLPSDRVKPHRAFFITGVDFAGPITTLVSKSRGRKTTNKSYIALFICFSTKAVHLEAVSDLSTASFIAALHRFVGRRGCPQRLFCDNATNFRGAKTELGKLYDAIRLEFRDSIDEFCSVRNIEWSFIPPSSPHMGGLWEAGVKSCKFHLKRVIGLSLLTFEELATVLIQIEACLNSRPICCLPGTPLDLQPLTPAHFLVGEPLTNLPDVDVTDIAMNRLSRWQVVQRITQDFWKRWKREYLTSLQGRTKWTRERANLKTGNIVLISDYNSPPLQWSLGRVTELHPGADNRVRVATIKTASSLLKRPIVKLCKLPVDDHKINQD